MPHVPEDVDPALWHQFFAMECNNRAWELSTVKRTADQDMEMLNAAHSSHITGIMLAWNSTISEQRCSWLKFTPC
jgi:hypothetical protein